MKKGTIVERNYLISNLERYQNNEFLVQLDKITADEGITILERTVDEKNGSVKIQARFDSDHWDVCQAIEYLTKNKISVKPIGDFVILAETDECQNQLKITVNNMKEVLNA